MDIQKIPASRLNAAAYNPRKDLKPGDREYEKLKRSIAEFLRLLLNAYARSIPQAAGWRWSPWGQIPIPG